MFEAYRFLDVLKVSELTDEVVVDKVPFFQRLYNGQAVVACFFVLLFESVFSGLQQADMVMSYFEP